MQDFPLNLRFVFEHGEAVRRRSRVIGYDGVATTERTFGEVAERVRRLAGYLRSRGVVDGRRVATLMWNSPEHFETQLAVPLIGGVVHTLNVRLLPDQIAWIARHAEDAVLVVEGSLLPLAKKIVAEVPSLEHLIVATGETDGFTIPAVSYEDALRAAAPIDVFDDIDERAGALMCYTSGTTGDPKGVVYSHRSMVLHTFAQCAGFSFGLNERDRILMSASMFHAAAWGFPLVAWMTGADLVLPGRHLQPEPLSRLIAATRPTFAGGVPTIWKDLLDWSRDHDVDYSSLRGVLSAGSAVPRSLMERFQERFGVPIHQAWGMTETGPLAAIGFRPEDAPPETEFDWRECSGRVIPGVEMRIVGEDGEVCANDGTSIGEVEVRGLWVTGSYYRVDADERFREGWLRTGDVGTLDDHGFLRLVDRKKDVIKSGGEWVSSVELECLLTAHPEVREAAVIGVADERWGERPLAIIVRHRPGTAPPAELRAFLAPKVPSFWIPERWATLDAIPKTSVGKIDKKLLRRLWSEGSVTLD